jgi:hypothetical protein
MTFDFTLPMFAATEFWMARWLTPIWFLGGGVILGLLVLCAFLLVFYCLSKIKLLEQFRRDGSAHVIAALLTLVLGGACASYTRFSKDGQSLFGGGGTFANDEWAMISIAFTMMVAAIVWSVLYCSSARFLGELRSLLFEGIGLYMFSALAGIAVIGGAATFLVEKPMAAIQAVPQLFAVSDSTEKFTVAPIGSNEESAAFQKIDLRYDPALLGQVEISSDKRIVLLDAPSIGEVQAKPQTIEAGQPLIWNTKMGASECPLPMAPGAEIYVQNQEIDSAALKIRVISIPPVREASTFVLVAFFVALFGLLFMLMQAVSPKVAAIALSAAKSELSQPLPIILIIVVALAILLFVFLPFHTLGEDIKLLKDCGVTLILIAATFQAVWSASTSVNEEIEGRTALTLLSKPIHRRSFIIGKILGVFWIVLLMFLVLGTFELFSVAYKPIYEARENSLEQPGWQQCHQEMMQTIPGLALAFFQAVVLGSFSVALGTRFSLLANFTICFSIYLLGHLTPTIVESAAGGLPLVEFFSQLISAVVPNLSHFSMEAAIDAEVSIPWSVIASVLVYTSIYGIAATLMGLLLFEDRDLA